MGMGTKSLKWEAIGTKNLFLHTSNFTVELSTTMCVLCSCMYGTCVYVISCNELY